MRSSIAYLPKRFHATNRVLSLPAGVVLQGLVPQAGEYRAVLEAPGGTYPMTRAFLDLLASLLARGFTQVSGMCSHVHVLARWSFRMPLFGFHSYAWTLIVGRHRISSFSMPMAPCYVQAPISQYVLYCLYDLLPKHSQWQYASAKERWSVTGALLKVCEQVVHGMWSLLCFKLQRTTRHMDEHGCGM